jgi:hypothetical protein
MARVRQPVNLPTEVVVCTRAAAMLRLYHDGGTDGRTLNVLPVAEMWDEQTSTWATPPATTGPPASVVAGTGGGYLRGDVTAQVADAHHEFLLGEAEEVDPEGSADTRCRSI